MMSAGVVCGQILQALYIRGTLLRNLLVFLLVWAAKEAITHLFFSCPCYHGDESGDHIKRLVYGCLYMAVPGLIFWMMGVLLIDSTWRCLTSCRNQPRPRIGQCCVCCGQLLACSGLAPVTWATLIFLDGSYLQCVMSDVPPPCLEARNLSQSQTEAVLARNTDINYLSGIIGCCVAGGCFLIYFTVVLLYRCCGNTSYYQSLYAQQVRSLEQSALLEAAQEELLDSFTAKWKTMFRSGTKLTWSDASTLPYVFPEPDQTAGYIYTHLQALDTHTDHSVPQTLERIIKHTDQTTLLTDSLQQEILQEKRKLPPLLSKPYREIEPYTDPRVIATQGGYSGLGPIVDTEPIVQKKKTKKRKVRKGQVEAAETGEATMEQ